MRFEPRYVGIDGDTFPLDYYLSNTKELAPNPQKQWYLMNTSDTKKKVYKHKKQPRWDLNPQPPEPESSALRLRHSVILILVNLILCLMSILIMQKFDDFIF